MCNHTNELVLQAFSVSQGVRPGQWAATSDTVLRFQAERKMLLELKHVLRGYFQQFRAWCRYIN